MQHKPETMEVVAQCHLAEATDYVQTFQTAMKQRWPEGRARTRSRAAKGKRERPAGRPGLDHDDMIYRLAKAEEAEEIRRADPDMWWKMVAKQINWRYGISDRGLALLRDARKRLRRLDRPLPTSVRRLPRVLVWHHTGVPNCLPVRAQSAEEPNTGSVSRVRV
ncbi:MAG: hypothetical protein CEE40_00020 [Chloroflexi bacterium B3_Chlor]|nr:MAG: hypothetical protein CEE40_00020 [Chloroflexi bacterium B3_Chlor]